MPTTKIKQSKPNIHNSQFEYTVHILKIILWTEKKEIQTIDKQLCFRKIFILL